MSDGWIGLAGISLTTLTSRSPDGDKNIVQTSRMAEKYNALRLKEVCCDFILANIDALDNIMLDNLFAVMPRVGRACLQKQKKEYQGTELANKLLGVNLAELEPFKKRAEFRSRHDYSRYVWANIQPNMLVRCVEIVHWDGYSDRVPEGTLGRVVSTNFNNSMVTVKWQGKRKCVGPFMSVELLTPPIECDIFA